MTELMKNAVQACHNVFPFTNIMDSQYFITPNWIKYLNYQSHKLKNTNDIIKYFLSNKNYSSDSNPGLQIPRVHQLILQDIGISILDPFVFQNEIKSQWKEEDIKVVKVKYF